MSAEWQKLCGMASPLAAYLDSTDTTSAAFAARLGVDQTAVMRWRKGERFPRADVAFLIEEITGGLVTAKALANYARSERKRRTLASKTARSPRRSHARSIPRPAASPKASRH